MRRRTVLAAAAGFGVGAASGCAAPTAPPTTRDDTSGGPETEPEDPSSAPSPAAPGTVLGAAAAVPVGGATVYPSAAVVVARPGSTTYVAFSAVCPHAGCLVDKVQDGTIHCPCHGSRFHLDGTVAAGPAARPLTSVRVTVQGDTLVLP